MSDCPSPLQHRLQVTFQSENEEAYAALERLIGCARRTGVALMSLRVTKHGENCHGYLRVGAEHRDPIDLLSNRLAMLIGLDELMCCHEPIHAGSSHKAASKKKKPVRVIVSHAELKMRVALFGYQTAAQFAAARSVRPLLHPTRAR
jgi:hypothetical protein